MDKARLWTKDFLIVSTENFFIYLTYYLLMVTITVYAAEHFNATPSEAGLASGIFIIGALVARLFAGRSIERIGRKKMLYFGFIFFLLTSLLYFIASSLPILLVIRFFHGAGFGVASTATGTIVASIIPNERRGEGTGYYAMSTTMASAIGPFLGMFLNQHGSFRMIFVLSALLLAISLFGAFFLNETNVELTKEQLAKMKGFKVSNFFEVKAIPISIIGIFIGLSYSSILTFLNTYTKEINLVNAGSFFFIMYAGFILISRPFTGRWFDNKGENFVMYPSFILFIVGLLTLSQAHHGLALLMAGAFVGLGYGTYLSSAQAISIKVSPRHRMGLATSTFFIFIDGGIGIGPFILGFFVPIIGFRGLYISMAIVVFCCIFLYYFLHGKNEAHQKKFAKAS